MALTPEPADLAPTRDHEAYSRRPLFGVSFIVMMVLCLACVVGGYLFAVFGPRLFPVRTAPTRAWSATAPAPGPPWQTSTTTTQLLVRPPVAATPGTAPAAVTDPNLAAPMSPAADLTPRIEDIEARQSAVLAAAAAALAAANLSQASQGGRPFAEAFAAAAQVMPDSPDVRALQPLAAIGAPSRAALAAEFEGMIGPVAIAAEQPTGPDTDLWDHITYALSSIVTVRRIEPDGQGASPPILRIERMVGGGDLEPALAAINTLPGAARDRLGGWRIRAERRVEIDRRVAGIRSEALARLQRLPRTAVSAPVAVAPPVITPTAPATPAPVTATPAPIAAPSAAPSR